MKTMCIGILILAVCWATGARSVNAAELNSGVAVRDITPPTGYRMSGYFSERFNTGTHDPLQAKAIVFQQGDEKAALVFCDIIGIVREVSDRARAIASKRTGIPASNILIAATHSHTGPLYAGAIRDRFHEQAVAEHGKDPHEAIAYADTLTATLVETIAAAQAAARPVSLTSGTAQETTLSFNRRFHMKGGGPVRFNPGKLNPNILRVAGPIDPDVGILLARDAQGNQPLFALTVFALHLDTVGGTDYSADYPQYLEQGLRSELGDGLVSVFGIGTCGDINHVDVSHGRPQKGQVEAKRIGTKLAATVLDALPGLATAGAPALAARSVTVDVPLRACTPEEVAQARIDMAHVGDGAVPFLDRVTAYRIVSQASRGSAAIPLEVQVFRLDGRTAIVGLPGEVFVDLGLAIKAGSPFENTLVVELTNDYAQYIPTRKAFAEGSYETVNSIVASGGGEMLADAAVRLLKELL
ncbi:MAG: hypothetical protein GWP08_06965 [Nitrospiraceae bacterium]|nr:hypothetical protein [Nitrospiraceae bacterium]